jgi:hypothetical protein
MAIVLGFGFGQPFGVLIQIFIKLNSHFIREFNETPSKINSGKPEDKIHSDKQKAKDGTTCASFCVWIIFLHVFSPKLPLKISLLF